MPSEEHIGPQMLVRVISIDGYTVCSWCPTPDGSGPPEAVGLILPIRGKDEDDEIKIMLRLKSRRAVKELILALEKHRDDVFPITGDPEN